jgi:hypothetical protein
VRPVEPRQIRARPIDRSFASRNSAKLVNAAPAIETDDTVTTGQQAQECASSLSSEEKHPLGPVRNWDIADDR